MFTLEVDNHVTSIINGNFTKEQYAGFKKALGYPAENAKWIIRSKIEAQRTESDRKRMKAQMEAWDGYFTAVCYNRGCCKCYTKKGYTHFPTGLLTKARQFLNKCGIEYQLFDARRKVSKGMINLSMSEHFELRDYQREAVDNACNSGRGIIKMATGSGKTATIANLIVELGVVPFIFYVTSCDLLEQAQSELQKFIYYNGSNLEVGRVGGGYKEIKDVTVMTVQTAIRALDLKWENYDDCDSKDKTDIEDIKVELRDYIRGARAYVADEVHHWSCSTCLSISDASKSAYFRFGASASPYRDMGDDIMIEGCFGKTLIDISASFLIRRGYLIKPDIYFMNINNMKHSPYSSYSKVYENCLKRNSFRNQQIANIATTMVEQGRLPLVLVKQIEHGKILEKLIPNSSFIHGSHSKKKRAAHLEKMRNRECGVTIASVIFDEGVDVKPLDGLILAGSGKSATRALQRVGRVLRPYPNVESNIKQKPLVVDFNDDCKYLSEHSAKRRKIYETEPEFDIKEM